jgi:hypothetical protein
MSRIKCVFMKIHESDNMGLKIPRSLRLCEFDSRPRHHNEIKRLRFTVLIAFCFSCVDEMSFSPHPLPTLGKSLLPLTVTANTRITQAINASRPDCSLWFALMMLSIPWLDRLPQVERSPSRWKKYRVPPRATGCGRAQAHQGSCGRPGASGLDGLAECAFPFPVP